jgi:NAD+ synthase (glutamine-hydrolysing)
MEKKDFGFLRVAAISPDFVLGDSMKAAREIIALAQKYAKEGARLIVFPELCLTGYTVADLFNQEVMQKGALNALKYVCKMSTGINALLVVGLPLRVNNAMFNVAALIDHGKIMGIVPKSYIPSSNEFYEGRWFAGANCLTVDEVEIIGQIVPIGTDILFVSKQDDTAVIGIVICEDEWVPVPPSSSAAIAGATVIANLSASNELVGKANYRRELVKQQSGRCICAYLYCSAGPSESTTDVVFGGHLIIAENSIILKESKRFIQKSNTIVADIDTQALAQERIRTTSFAQSSDAIAEKQYRRIKVDLPLEVPNTLERPNPFSQFVPEDPARQEEVCLEVFAIQTAGLAWRLRSMKQQMLRDKMPDDPHVVIGVSGGLDSALALLVSFKAFTNLGYDLANIHAYSMPSVCTSCNTKSNADLLAKALGIELEKIPIDALVNQILAAIGHDGITQDVIYENAQARARTLILMEQTNIFIPSIVIGTGDLSEIALGWCTYNGDQMSHYNVNCGVPKTLVRYVIDWAVKTSDQKLRQALTAILDTVISPELTSARPGEITQKTEEKIGPFVLHDFFLYHFVRRGSGPKKIVYLAKLAFSDKYDEVQIKRWLRVFINRFFANQFKRSSMPEGPRVGLVDLSPRGSLRIPSGISPEQWLAELDDEM